MLPPIVTTAVPEYLPLTTWVPGMSKLDWYRCGVGAQLPTWVLTGTIGAVGGRRMCAIMSSFGAGPFWSR